MKKIYQAGFDLSDIEADIWKVGLEKFNLQDGILKIGGSYQSGWFWIDKENPDNFVVTANNPITGQYCSEHRSIEKDYVSYVGIQGSAEFVADFFLWFKKNASNIKSEDFGCRGYI